MYARKWLLSLSLLAVACTGSKVAIETVTVGHVQEIINIENDTLYILNFWATWCQPCKEELPYFDRITQEHEGEPLKVLLINVDEARFVETQLKPFVKKEKLRSEVMWLNRENQRDWIDQISDRWQGNIPVTLFVFYPKGIVDLHDREISYEELIKRIQNITSP